MLKTDSVSRTKLFEHDLIEFKELESEMVDGKRYYKTPTGEKYPSVTTILSSFDKEGILAWRKRVGEEEANKITRIATRRGTKVHTMMERYILNEDDIGKGMMPSDIELFNQLKPLVDENLQTVMASEIPLYSHELKCAGRCDLIAKFFNRVCIVDYKTSRKKKKREWIENYFLQATAYSMMLEEIYSIKATDIAIMIATDTGEPQLFHKTTEELRPKVRLLFSQYHENNRT